MRTLLSLGLASTLVATTAALAMAPADANTDPVQVRDYNVTVVMSTAGTTGNRDTEHPVLGPARESRLSSSSSTSPTFDSEGNLYLADPGYSQIVKLAPTASGTYDVVAKLGSPRGIVLRQVVITKTGRYTIGKVRMNPTKADTDGDGLTDKEEVTGSRNRRFSSAKSDPSRADTDKGGIRDGSEVRQGTNPVSS